MKAQVQSEAARILSVFLQAGAQQVEADILQPAETLLDLYGEDIRARAYVTHDPVRGELMLRPDFTLPVVERHIGTGAEPARYAYSGEVFRRQEEDETRASEFIQVGYEVLGGADAEATDAEVFSLFSNALRDVPAAPVIGDIGLLTAAVQGLTASAPRKAALMRHIWRPARFRTLLDRFSGRLPVPPTRAALLAGATSDAPLIGLRTEAEIAARIAALAADAAEPPLDPGQVALIGEILALASAAPVALELLRDIAADLPAIAPAVRRLDRRLGALSDRGVDVDRLRFEASHGRSAMEYYDGFVFSFQGNGEQPLASGGRYDALTARLGRAIPAVGGVVRPDLVLEARG